MCLHEFMHGVLLCFSWATSANLRVPCWMDTCATSLVPASSPGKLPSLIGDSAIGVPPDGDTLDTPADVASAVASCDPCNVKTTSRCTSATQSGRIAPVVRDFHGVAWSLQKESQRELSAYD